MSHRVLIVVTHLLGTGHLARALVLARAFSEAGDEVVVASGGMPAPHLNAQGLTVEQLPPLRSDGTDFTRLLDAEGGVAQASLYEAREVALTALVGRMKPDIVITELFPFGRRSLTREFTALLEAATALPTPARLFASVRDILAPPSKPRKAIFAQDFVAQYYDRVLVHSDPDVIALSASWPVTDALHNKLAYTGFVAPKLPQASSGTEGHGEILVSAGGGSVGHALYTAALGAARGDARIWRVLVAGHDATARIEDLQATAPANVVLEPARPDFRVLLQRCAASVSLCGYNTAMDVLQSAVPAVMIAFDDGAEVEQGLRATALAALPALETLPLTGITHEALGTALARALRDQKRRDTAFAFDGAARTREICIAGLSA